MRQQKLVFAPPEVAFQVATLKSPKKEQAIELSVSNDDDDESGMLLLSFLLLPLLLLLLILCVEELELELVGAPAPKPLPLTRQQTFHEPVMPTPTLDAMDIDAKDDDDDDFIRELNADLKEKKEEKKKEVEERKEEEKKTALPMLISMDNSHKIGTTAVLKAPTPMDEESEAEGEELIAAVTSGYFGGEKFTVYTKEQFDHCLDSDFEDPDEEGTSSFTSSSSSFLLLSPPFFLYSLCSIYSVHSPARHSSAVAVEPRLILA